jgi:hypothetical protein
MELLNKLVKINGKWYKMKNVPFFSFLGYGIIDKR